MLKESNHKNRLKEIDLEIEKLKVMVDSLEAEVRNLRHKNVERQLFLENIYNQFNISK